MLMYVNWFCISFCSTCYVKTAMNTTSIRAFATIYIICFVIGITSCDSSRDIDDQIDLIVAPTFSVTEDSLRATLTNRSSEAVGYNFCFTSLEREGSTVSADLYSPDSFCQSINFGLSPGESDTAAFPFPGRTGLGGAGYRLLTRVVIGSREEIVRIPSNAFTIQ